MQFESTTQYFYNKYKWYCNLDFQLFGPQIRLQRPKKPPNSECHRNFSIFFGFRNFGSHIESEILRFILLTINCGQPPKKLTVTEFHENPPVYESLKIFGSPY